MLRQRMIPVAGCLISAGILLGYSRIRQHLPQWWEAHGGGIPYVVFWILFWYSIVPRPKLITPICWSVVFATCLLEFTQLWNPAPLAAIRQTAVGAALLGSSFGWNDLPPYFAGGLVGWLILKFDAAATKRTFASAQKKSES